MLKYRQDKDGTVTFQVNCELYPLTAIYRAAYLFTDRYYIGLDRKEDSFEISFSRKDKAADYRDVGEFQNELLNQSMRAAIGTETRDIRKLIVTRALYSAFIPEVENREEPLEQKEKGQSAEAPNKEQKEYDLDDIAKAWYDE